MAKTTYTAVVNGKEVTRSTARTYTHAVVWASNDGKMVEADASFCGSLVLAQKQLAKDTTRPDRYYGFERAAKFGLEVAQYETWNNVDGEPVGVILRGSYQLVEVTAK